MGSKRKSLRWTIVETKRASALEAARHCKNQGFEYYHPLYREGRVGGVRKILPLFPNYLFVRVAPVGWQRLCSTRGIAKVMTCGDNILHVRDSEVDHIRSREDEMGYVRVDTEEPPAFSPDQKVVGIRGLFEGQDGIYQGMSERNRVRVMFRIFEREVVAEVSAWDLRAA